MVVITLCAVHCSKGVTLKFGRPTSIQPRKHGERGRGPGLASHLTIKNTSGFLWGLNNRKRSPTNKAFANVLTLHRVGSNQGGGGGVRPPGHPILRKI
jgi:hypothetical protein